jgi:hypothetical protein
MYICIFLISFGCSKDDTKTSTESGFYEPSGVISQERGIELSQTWNSKNLSLFSKASNTKFDEEIKSNWWSLEDLRNYLNYAEHDANSKGYNMTGVRVYFGAYPEKEGQNTMFFAPTGHKSISEASVFSLFLPPTDDDIPVNPLNDGTGGQGGYPD